MIKPIETYYNGLHFRSRLEARWAVFFDAMKIPYEYEPEGYKFEDGTLYLPDFRIQVRHRSNTDEWEPVFVEIKGLMSPRDKQKIEKLSEYHPVIVLGDLPANEEEYFDRFDECDGFHSYRYMDDDEYPAAFSIYKGIPWICGPDHDEYDGGKTMNAALLKARQARFEYGETPKIKMSDNQFADVSKKGTMSLNHALIILNRLNTTERIEVDREELREAVKAAQKALNIVAYLPPNHGRLIDADAFLKWLKEFHPSDVAIMSGIKNTRTIIEAEANE